MILLTPHITEKAYAGVSEEKGGANTYVFKVPRTARKEEIRAAVEGQFKVHVDDIRVVNLPAKQRLFRGKKGMTQAIRKAIVRLQKGERIAAFDIETATAKDTEAKTAEETAN